MMPDYRGDNPYQSLLADALTSCGANVMFPVGYRRVLPLYRAVKDNRPVDVLHLHWTEAYTRRGNLFSQTFRWVKLLVDLEFVRSTGTAVVWTMHNVLPHECRHPRLERYFRRGLTKRVSRLFVHGQESREAAKSVLHCPDERITVTPHGNFRSAYPPPTTEMRLDGRQGLATDHRVFLFFGMMRPYKGLERLVRVWQSVKPEHATLRLVGPCIDAKYETDLRNLVRNVPGATLSCKFVEGDGVTRIFAASDVVVLPFEKIQTSGSVILAASFGKPVIAPRLGEIPEALRGAADLLYEPGTDSALEAAIRRALKIDLSELASRSNRAASALDWELAAIPTLATYRFAVSIVRPTEAPIGAPRSQH
jgi:beta-1,4-mannosyltransferase